MIRVVEISALANGAHRNQTYYNAPKTYRVPDGWALIPDRMQLENFPFGTVEAEEIGGVMTLTKWTAGEIPAPPEPQPPEPSEQDKLEAQVYYTAMMTDTLLEE